MKEQFSRTAIVFGKDAIKKLQNCRVAVFGIGGVGGHAVEVLARSGVGALDLIDFETISESNINRQLLATHSTVGEYKVDVAKKRVLDINPDCKVTVYKTFFLPKTADVFDFSKYDYIIDTVDTVTAKIELIETAKKHNVPVISAMGAGNKTDPTAFKVADISKTKVCPLAKVMRLELKKRKIRKVKVVYSEELPTITEAAPLPENYFKRSIPGSTPFVPPVVGMIVASEVVKDLLGFKKGDANGERT